MGIRNAWRIRNYNKGTGWAGTPSTAAYSTPWATGASLAPVIIAGQEILRTSTQVTMAQAMGIPPIARAVMMYTAVVAGQPLTAAGEVPQGVDLSWLNSTGEGALSPAVRNAQLVQDIFFAGHTLLQVTRDSDGYVNDAVRMPLDRWNLDEAGYVLIDGQEVHQDSVVYIPGLLPFGFLTYAASTIRHYEAMTATLESRSANPVPLIAIYVDEDCPLDDDEIQQVLDNWSAARKAKNGAVAVVPKGIRIEVLGEGSDDGQMLTSARNAARLDVANFVNLTAALVDGNNGTSGTYENTLQNQNEFNALSLPLFTLPIAARLSQDDVTPPGVSVQFDASAFDAAPSDAQGNLGTAVSLTKPAPTTTTTESATA